MPAFSSHLEEELKPDLEASRVIADQDLINIDIKELNKMLKERGISKVSKYKFDQTNFFSISTAGTSSSAEAKAADSEEPRIRSHCPSQERGDQGRSRDQTQLCRLGGEEIQVRRDTSNYPDICK